jgi:hypothetical protein
MKTLYTVLIASFFSNLLLAAIINVPGDKPTIQAAINFAVKGDTILVSPGVYYENINFKNKGIVVASKFILNQDISFVESTIINGSQPAHLDTASCVLIFSKNQNDANDTSNALIGFTIMGGKGTVWEDEHQPGLFYREGGGILIQYLAPRILFNIIKDNEAINKNGIASAGGGAIRCGDGNPKILNNIIINNKGLYGAGIVLNYSGALIKNNIIAYNSGGEDYGGSGLWINGNDFLSRPRIVENNTIVYNSSVRPGGGFNIYNVSTTIRNNIVWGNYAPSSPQIRGGINVVVSYCNVEGGYSGTGNINFNPMFTDSSFLLKDSSKCIDAGDPSSTYNDPEDLTRPGFAKFPSKGLIRNDIGAYGGPGRTKLSTILTSSKDEKINSFSGFCLEQNYPNPFNPATSIQYSVDSRQHVSLKVFDVLGNEVATLVNEEKQPGTYEVEFSSLTIRNYHLTSGIYFYQLRAGSFVQTNKMLMIK